jgi:peroxiredoxin Q/BCP
MTKEMVMAVEIGSPAPAFALETANGTVTLAEQTGAGKAVVLYFYPKDDTPGCTKEAIAFSGLEQEFAAAGAVVIGVSRDSVASHQKFAAKHDLSVILASDPEGDTIEAYGAWVEKAMYGKKYMGIERATVLIGRDGRVAQIWRKVKVPGHAEAVLEAVRALG